MPVVHLSENDFAKEVLNSETPTLVDFYTTWCGPCKAMAPVLEDIAKDYSGKLKVVKINVEEASSVANQYSIMSVPTLIIFKNGDVQKQIVGVVSNAVLRKKIEAVI